MSTSKLRHWLAATLLAAAATAAFAMPSHAAESTTVAALTRDSHLHGIAVDRSDPRRLHLATHHGLYAVAPDGSAELVSPVQDLMGFTPHPSEPATLYASGHPAGGGNLGFIASADGGKSWTRLADGAGGPVDFHQMDVSPADPETIYGAHGGSLQVSRDGGESWQVVGAAPEGLIDLAAASTNAATLYAATQGGLLRSEDGGRTWQDAYWLRRTATMVHVTPDGTAYAFVAGTGLITTAEPKLNWRTIGGTGLGSGYVLHLAVDPTDPAKLYAVTLRPEDRAQQLLASRDGGKTWEPLAAG